MPIEVTEILRKKTKVTVYAAREDKALYDRKWSIIEQQTVGSFLRSSLQRYHMIQEPHSYIHTPKNLK